MGHGLYGDHCDGRFVVMVAAVFGLVAGELIDHHHGLEDLASN